jgi:hypothetical protein
MPNNRPIIVGVAAALVAIQFIFPPKHFVWGQGSVISVWDYCERQVPKPKVGPEAGPFDQYRADSEAQVARARCMTNAGTTDSVALAVRIGAILGLAGLALFALGSRNDAPR